MSYRMYNFLEALCVLNVRDIGEVGIIVLVSFIDAGITVFVCS